MIDPVSLIVNALIVGITEGVTVAAGEAVADSYRALRNRLTEDYGAQVEGRIRNLEENPKSAAYQNLIAQELSNLGAREDHELTRLASHLINLAENPDASILANSSSSPTTDPVEMLLRSVGFTNFSKMLDDHVAKALVVRSQYEIDDEDLLSKRVPHNANLPIETKRDLGGLHEQIRRIILHVATRIAETRYNAAEGELQQLQAGLKERQRAVNLLRADKQLHISYETLRITVEWFGERNSELLAKIQEQTNAQREINMMFGNSILIAELADFVIDFVERFTLGGDLEEIHAQAKARIAENRTQDMVLEQQLRTATDVDAATRDATLEDVHNRMEVFQELEREWDKYMVDVEELRGKVHGIQGRLPTLKIIRENAQRQIATLQLVAMLRFLKQNTVSIGGAVASLEGFRLAPLTPSRVRRLLGLD